MKNIKYTISQTIRKPIAEVFQAVVDDKILSTYFCKSASGPIVEGATVVWNWVTDGSKEFVVSKVTENEKIEGHWKADYVTTVFDFVKKDDSTTIVRITKSGFHDDETGRVSSYGQCNGWTHMLVCLKARLVFDIDLR